MKRNIARQFLIGFLIAVVALLSLSMVMAQGNGGNQPCPSGTTLIAKFNFQGGSYVFEKGTAGAITITSASASGFNWSSTVPVSAIVVKGGPGSAVVAVNPAATSGTVSNVVLPPVGRGNIPGISNVQFCGGATPPPATPTPLPTVTPPPPTPTAGDCIPQGMADLVNISLANVPDANGFISGSVTNSSATNSYEVGMAVYRKFDEVIANQQLFSSETKIIGPGETATFTLPVPGCAAQVDLFCGPVIPDLSQQLYGARLLNYTHIGGSNYCE